MHQAMVTTTLLLNARVKQVSRVAINSNAELQTLCTRLRDDDVDIMCLMEGVGHLIRHLFLVQDLDFCLLTLHKNLCMKLIRLTSPSFLSREDTWKAE